MKRKNLVRTIIVIVILLWSGWKLYPTVRLNTLSMEQREKLQEKGKLVELQNNAIKRGLDLQGGMYLVLEVDIAQLLDNLAKRKDEKFNQILEKTRRDILANPQEDFLTLFINNLHENNLRLSRYFGSPAQKEDSIIKMLRKEAKDAIDRSLHILRNRVDQFGVSEPNIQKQGSHRIVIELPGIKDIDRAKALIGKTALLEFKLLKEQDITTQVLRRINEELKRIRKGKKGTEQEVKQKTEKQKTPSPEEKKIIRAEDLFGTSLDTAQIDTSAQDTTGLMVDQEIFEENPFFALLRDMRSYGGEIAVPEKNVYAVNKILNMPEIQKVIPPDAQFLWSGKPVKIGDFSYYELFFVKKEPELTGKYLTDADVQIGGGSSLASAGKPVVTMKMNSEGAKIFARVTGANVGRRLAIVLDNKVYSAPRINTKIPHGNAIIEGMADMKEAKDLAIVLRAGALPAPVKIIEERTVGPSLGADSIRKGTKSAIIGLILVIVFMMIYYRLSGLIADIALVMNLIIILAVLAGFHFTLTLPGVAGIILTIGMAVDANVLIFERIREELRTGKTIRASIDAGYSRAFTTILDANITTLITAIVLYQFGTGPIRGFALTLSIGILSSMFTALVVTRLIFDYITEKFALRKLSI
ncbi:protein translocase subunit SecD [candidate division KSB1 bacterium]|nr:MAG: protein translocase subunit SecD [candidate division KSB1 bacterium]